MPSTHSRDLQSMIASLPFYPKPLTSPRFGDVPGLGAVTPCIGRTIRMVKNKSNGDMPVVAPRHDFVRNAFTIADLDEDRRKLLYSHLERIMDAADKQAATILTNFPEYDAASHRGPELYYVGIIRSVGDQVLEKIMADTLAAVRKMLGITGTKLNAAVEGRLWEFAYRAEDFAAAWLGQIIFYRVGPTIVTLGRTEERVRELTNQILPGIAGNTRTKEFVEPLREWFLECRPRGRKGGKSGRKGKKAYWPEYVKVKKEVLGLRRMGKTPDWADILEKHQKKLPAGMTKGALRSAVGRRP